MLDKVSLYFFKILRTYFNITLALKLFKFNCPFNVKYCSINLNNCSKYFNLNTLPHFSDQCQANDNTDKGASAAPPAAPLVAVLLDGIG